jgi:hypothetical protein
VSIAIHPRIVGSIDSHPTFTRASPGPGVGISTSSLAKQSGATCPTGRLASVMRRLSSLMAAPYEVTAW